ncbi:hypothetical protein MTO96_013342 [Rhipicephalus appendiculatus]
MEEFANSPKNMKENPTPRPGSTQAKEDPYGIPKHLHIACTKRDDARCHLLQYRRSLNQVLRDIGLEICEDATCDDAIRIAIVQENGRGYVFESMYAFHITALNVVQFLLTEHECITSVEVNRIMRHREPLLKALRLNRAVETVVISGMDAERSPEDVAAFKAVMDMSQMKRLILDTAQCPPQYANMRLLDRLHRGATRRLTTLDVAAAEMSPKQAKRLISALTQRKTVQHLVVGENVFTNGKEGSGRSFANYLVNTDTLRTLRLTSKPNFTDEKAIRTLVNALCQARTLVEVMVDLDLKMVGFAARVSLFAQVVAENATLRRLRLPSVKCPCAHSWMNEALLDPPDPDSADKMAPWLGAPECRDFFEAVADNDALHSVVVRRLPAECQVDGICKTIRERGIADRVLIGNHHVSPVDVSALSGCPEITGVVVSSRHFFPDWKKLRSLFKTLARCPHVTSLSVLCWRFEKSTFESLIAYMGATKTLEKIEVHVVDVVKGLTDEEHLDLDRQLVEAAASIPSLVEANFTGMLRYAKLCAAFAGAVAAKRGRLTRLQITLAYLSNPAFANLYTPQKLAGPFRQFSCEDQDDSNFKRDAATAREITARNSNDVSAAARYVLDKRDSDDGARVIEELHDHPWLVHKVRRQADFGVGEAKAKIALAFETCADMQHRRLHETGRRRQETRSSALTGMEEFADSPKNMKENPTARPGSTEAKEDPYSIPKRLNIACTKRDDARCHLLQYRRSLNQVLRNIGLEICEDATCDDGIRIAIVQACGYGYLFIMEAMEACEVTALNVVQFLLTEHECITSVEVNRIMRHREPLLKALRLNRAVETVVISGMDAERSPEDVAAFKAVKSMSQLKRLILDTSRCPPQYANMRLYGQLLRGATRRLTTLDVASAQMSPKQTKRLIGALRRRKTVQHLVVGENVITNGKRGSGRSFANYLVTTDTLRKLRFTSRPNFTNEKAVRALVIALCQAKTLVEVKADLDLKMVGFAARVSLFAQVVAENVTLRRLRLPSVKCPCAHSWMDRALLDPPDPDSADKMVPWLGALRKNSTLHELEIDLGGFGEPECRDFFEAVADNDALHSVVVRRLPAECQVDGICKTIRERGIADRVFIGNHHVRPNDVSAMPGCPEITGVVVSSRHFPDWKKLRSLFKTLARCPHVTSLSVHCWNFVKSAFESLISYMGATKTLEKIEIHITNVLPELTDEQHLDNERRLVEAAASIPRLVEANFTGILQQNKLCAAFTVATKRRRLTRLQIARADRSNPAFTNLYTPQELARPSRQINFEVQDDSNFKSNAATVREITARNSNDVSAAARYVLGKRRSDGGARVIEELHDHPWLARKVRRLAEVGVGEAKAQIVRALKRVRTCGIDEYMRLAGVVKRRVQSAEGEGPVDVQIADVNEYCWLHIRSFLKVSDVVGA